MTVITWSNPGNMYELIFTLTKCLLSRYQVSHRTAARGSVDLAILDSRVLAQTVSHAAVRYTVMRTVRAGFFLGLNPVAMYVVSCRSVERSGRMEICVQ